MAIRLAMAGKSARSPKKATPAATIETWSAGIASFVRRMTSRHPALGICRGVSASRP
jgi:hypothetical protein